jgi:hypothetical protein
MDAHGYVKAVPTVDESSIEARPLLGLNSGYIQRATGVLPRQGSRDPWNLRQNYVLDAFTTRFGDVNEDMVFTRGPRPGHDARAAERRMESKNAEPVIASV